MKRGIKHLAAWALALSLVLTLLPSAALAAESPPEPEAPIEAPVEEGEAAPALEEEPIPEVEEKPAGEEAAPEESEEEPVMTVEELPLELITSAAPEDTGLMPAANEIWAGTRYRDQLTGDCGTYYDNMEKAFKNHTIQYQTVNYGSRQAYAAVYKESQPVYSTGWYSSEAEATAEFDSNKNSYIIALQRTWSAFISDHPEYFWIRTDGTSYMIQTSSQTNAYGSRHQKRLLPFFAYNIHDNYKEESQRSALTAEINNSAADIINSCKNLPTVAKLACFDSWLAVNNQYNVAGTAKDPSKELEKDPSPWNATGALLSRLSPVCEGYAKAFKILCDKIEVPCITVSSSNHMWNMVQVDGKWYHMDCTWNDPGTGAESSTYSTRGNFLVASFGSSTQAGSHTIAQSLPYPQAAVQNYFNAAKTVWYADVSASTPGSGDNTCWIAGYAGKGGRMLGLENACSFYWMPGQNRLILLEGGSMNGASYRKVFIVKTADQSFQPVEAAREILDGQA